MRLRRGRDHDVVTEPALDPSLFPVTERWAYLNHATLAAPPAPVVTAMHRFHSHAAATGGDGFLERVASVRPVRQHLADLLGGDADGVAFTKNTTEAISLVAHGLRWREAHRAVVLAHDFPSTRLPVLALRHRKVDVVELEPVDAHHRVPLSAFESVLRGGNVKAVVCSWVQSNRGWRLDPAELAALCHRHGAILVLDVIQGLGVLPCRAQEWGVDLVACGSHKWLLSPEGVGAAWLSPALREALVVPAPGWRWMGEEASEAAYARPEEAAASRFEGGTLNGAGLAGLQAALGLLHGAGIDSVWRHVDALCDALVSGLESTGSTVLSDRSRDGRSAIVTFEPARASAEQVVAALAEQGFATSARTGGVRVSPHGYNTAEEIQRFVEAVAACG